MAAGTERSFDLSREARSVERFNRTQRGAAIVGGAAWIAITSLPLAIAVGAGPAHPGFCPVFGPCHSLPLSQYGFLIGFLSAIVGVGFLVIILGLLRAGPGPVVVAVGPEGLRFRYSSGRYVRVGWSLPGLRLAILDFRGLRIPATVNWATIRTRPAFLRPSAGLSPEALEAIVASARARGLTVAASEDRGTRTVRISAARS